jgi:hypothetical protein
MVIFSFRFLTVGIFCGKILIIRPKLQSEIVAINFVRKRNVVVFTADISKD